MERLEKTLYHDGIAFMRYSLAYPSGEEFSFAEEMTRGYAAYLEEDYFKALCALYDADPERRKRYRHRIVTVTQSCRLYQAGGIYSLYFGVSEQERDCAFGLTWDKTRALVLTARDFGVKHRREKRIFFDGMCLYIFSKKGKLVEKVTING